MMKHIVMALLLGAAAMAENFEYFLQRALKQSPYLQSSSLGVDRAKAEGGKTLRYENPDIEIGLLRFSPDGGSGDTGFSAALNQPVRLWGVGADKERLVQTGIAYAKTEGYVTRAQFVRDLSLLYTAYAEAVMLAVLGDEELRIAKKIYEISGARYENGTISRGEMLQAKIAYEVVKGDNAQRRLTQMRSYYALLEASGVNEEVELHPGHLFKRMKNREYGQSPELMRLDAQRKLSRAQAAVSSNSVEWMELSAEYENEPDQDVYSVGLGIPLAVFNTKSEEKTIAMLEAKQAGLLFQNSQARLQMRKNYLFKEAFELEAARKISEAILSDEEALLAMFEEAYAIASVNLLELQETKNRLIGTKKRLIEIKTALNRNAIYQNYYQGNYNE